MTCGISGGRGVSPCVAVREDCNRVSAIDHLCSRIHRRCARRIEEGVFPDEGGNDRRDDGRDRVLHPDVSVFVDDGFRAGLADAQGHLVAWCGWTGPVVPDDTMLDVQLRGDDEQ